MKLDLLKHQPQQQQHVYLESLAASDSGIILTPNPEKMSFRVGLYENVAFASRLQPVQFKEYESIIFFANSSKLDISRYYLLRQYPQQQQHVTLVSSVPACSLNSASGTRAGVASTPFVDTKTKARARRMTTAT